MKKLFQWSINTLLSLFLLIIVVLLFLLNSTQTAQWVADRYAPQYGFHYSKISGGLLSGVEVKDLSFKEERLVESLKIGWNIIPLLSSHVAITHIDATAIDKENIQKAVASFSTNRSEEDDHSSFLLPVTIGVSKLHLSFNPLEQSGVRFDTLELKAKDILYKNSAIEVGEFLLNSENNISTLHLVGGLEDRVVKIEKLSLQKIDTKAVTKLFASPQKSQQPKSQHPKSQVKSSSKSTNPLTPKEIIIKKFDCSIKQTSYDPMVLKSVELNGSKIIFDIPKLLAKSGMIDLNVSTNLATLSQSAKITDNQLISQGLLKPLKKLYEKYKIPLRDKAIESIPLTIDANQELLNISLLLKGENLLIAKEDKFNIQRLSLTNNLKYSIPKSTLRVESKGNISTPYAKKIRLFNLLRYEDNILKYSGKVIPGALEGIDTNYTKPLNNLKISYAGDTNGISAHLNSDAFVGKFVSSDFKKAELNLTTKSALLLNKLVTMPQPLEAGIVNINMHVPLDLAQITPLKADMNISSNIANVDATLKYDKKIKLLTTTTLPPNTLLKGFGKEINFKAIETIQTNLILAEKNLSMEMHSEAIDSNLNLNLKSKDIAGSLKVVDTNLSFNGNLDKNITLKHKFPSIQALMTNIHSLYALDPLPLDGDLALDLVVSQLKDITLGLNANHLLYKADRITNHELDNTALLLHFSDGNLTLDHYNTIFQKQKIFANKASRIRVQEDNIVISPLWINDQLQVTGYYNMQEKRGDIVAYAEKFNISHEMIDLNSKIDIQSKLDNNNTDITGSVTLLGGNLYIDMDKKSFASDSDIIIVQNYKKKQPSTFMDHLSMNVKVDTKKPLRYKTKDANIHIFADLLAQKSKNDTLHILGTANIMKGSFYRFQNKKFIFKKSLIAFTGDIKKPILDIKVLYSSINYDITIQITGDPQTPNIIFSSIPSLSKEQILSVILFDSEDAGDGSSGNDMMKMMGGAIAKSALSNLGVKIDHLSIGTDGSMEIGKKISDKVTIIYVNDEVSAAKIQYDYNKNIKATISTDGESSGADIIYRREF